MARSKVDKEAQEAAIQKAIQMDPTVEGLNRPWKKFFAQFYELDTLKVSQWQEVHVLAYICKRFKDVHGVSFGLSIKGAPCKSPDIYMIKQIMAMLKTSNMNTIKSYIDWMYDSKIIPNKVKLRKLGYFINPGLANEFFFYKKKEETIRRSTELPKQYKDLANQLGLSAATYGDLAFIKMRSDKATQNKQVNDPCFQLLANLEAMGFEVASLETLAE